MRFAQPLHHLEVVLPQQLGAPDRTRIHQRHDAVHVLMRHAGVGSSSSIITGSSARVVAISSARLRP